MRLPKPIAILEVVAFIVQITCCAIILYALILLVTI